MSPFRLMYGMQPRLPIELELPSGQLQLSMGSLCEWFGDIREQAADAIAMAQAKQKFFAIRFAIKHQGPHFQVGDFVLLVNTRNKTRNGGGGKLDPQRMALLLLLSVLVRVLIALKGVPRR